MSNVKIQLLEALFSKLSEDYDKITKSYFDVFQFIYKELLKNKEPTEIVEELNKMDQSLFFFAVPDTNRTGTTFINGSAKGNAIIRINDSVLQRIKENDPLNGAIILSNHIYDTLSHENIHQQQAKRIPKEKKVFFKYKDKLDYYEDPAEIAAFANTAAFQILSFIGYKEAINKINKINDYLYLCEISPMFKLYYGLFGYNRESKNRKVFYRFMKYLVHFIEINKERFSV